MVRTKFVNNFKKIRDEYAVKSVLAMQKTANNIVIGSRPRTPQKTGALRGDITMGRVSKSSVKLTWAVGYAAVQNAGLRRGARPFRKYTTVGTGKGFVAVGVDYARKRIKESFR